MISKEHAVGEGVDSICILKSPFSPKELMPQMLEATSCR